MKTLPFLLLCIIFIYNTADAKNYYISSSGNDQNSGTSVSSPWKTINKLNSFYSSIQAGDSILFCRGNEFYGSISILKSGTSSLPVVFAAYGSGTRPVITGFTSVSGWTNVGTNLWESEAVTNSHPKLNMLTTNGKVTAIGRFPNLSDFNKGYLTIDSHSGSTSITDNSLSSTPDFTGGELVLRARRYVLDRDSITNHSGSTLTYKSFTGKIPDDGFGYFIQNHQATLDKTGEWYYNPSSKKVRMYGSSAPSDIKISTVDYLVLSKSISNIRIDNINFTGANITAIRITGTSSNFKITNCDISSSGEMAVYATSSNFLLENANITYSLNKAIVTYGINSVIRNVVINNTGTIAGMGLPGEGQYYAVTIFGKGSLMELCEVDSSGYVAIRFNSDSSTIKNNVINTYCFIMDDGAGIYTWNGSTGATWSGKKIIGNIILNGIGAAEGTNTTIANAYGIYLDEKSNHIEVTDNTVNNASTAGLFIHNAYSLTIKGNLFYDNNIQVKMVHDKSTSPAIRNLVVNNNIEVSKTTSQRVGYYRSLTNDFSSFGVFDYNYYCRPILEPANISATSSGSSVGSIIYLSDGSSKYLSLDKWQLATNLDLNSKKTAGSVTDVSQLRFEYNATTAIKTISLGTYSYYGVDGTQYTQSITLAPYSSIVLLKGSLVTATNTVLSNTTSAVEQSIEVAQFKVRVYPNPSPAQFALAIKSLSKEDLLIQAVNVNGIQILNTKTKWTPEYKFGGNLMPGIYFFKITQGQHSQMIKLVKL